MTKLAENNPQGTANIADDRVLAVVNCSIDCHYGIEGHCGRTKYEYYHHCELLLQKNEEQRSKGTPLSVLFNNR
jgi:hypothetical protein